MPRVDENKSILVSDEVRFGNLDAFIANILISILGAIMAASWAAWSGVSPGADNWSLGTFGLAVVGAIFMLVPYNLMVRRP